MKAIEALFKTNYPRFAASAVAFVGVLQGVVSLGRPLTQPVYLSAAFAAILAGINWKKHDPETP